MKSYHNRGLFRTFPLLPCIQCSSLSKKQGEAMMVIEPILILVDLCWCTIHSDFNHSGIQRVLPISNSFLRLFGIRWIISIINVVVPITIIIDSILKYWLQLCPLLLQPDPLLHDQPHPAVGLVHAKTHKTTTGQNDADRSGSGGWGDYDDVEVFSLLWNLFSCKTKNKHRSYACWRFWWCLWPLRLPQS